MLTAEPAAVRRTVGELDFKFAMKAFNRACEDENPSRKDEVAIQLTTFHKTGLK
jgi:hypothetical protein